MSPILASPPPALKNQRCEHEAALGQGAVDAERTGVLVPDAPLRLRVEVRAEAPKTMLPKKFFDTRNKDTIE